MRLYNEKGDHCDVPETHRNFEKYKQRFPLTSPPNKSKAPSPPTSPPPPTKPEAPSPGKKG